MREEIREELSVNILELTATDGQKVYINAGAIEMIEHCPGKCWSRIEMISGTPVYVFENPKTVALMCGDITFAAVEEGEA